MGKLADKLYGERKEGAPSIAENIGEVTAAFEDELAAGFVRLAEKQEAREAASIAARQKTDQAGLAGVGGGGGGGKPTKLKADALARIGGFRGGISPEINLLKQQIQQQKMIARASKETANNTKALG